MSPLSSLLKSNFRAWISAKGFWLVAAAALLPAILTGAWVGAHQADIEISDIRMSGQPFTEGSEAVFSATVTNVGSSTVSGFNVSLEVGEVEAGSLFRVGNATPINDLTLAPGESRDIEMRWNATPGTFYVVASADPCKTRVSPCDDDVPERDEFNNQEAEPIAVSYRVPDASSAPSAPLGLAGDANATTEVDLEVVSITRSVAEVKPGDNVTFRVEVRNNGLAVENAPVAVRVVRAVGPRSVPVQDEVQNVSFATGETKTVELTWTTQQGVFWHEGYVTPPADAKDVAADNNYRIEAFASNPVVTDEMRPPDPEERLTIKEFYFQILSFLHLRLLLPLIALFYAAGVIADEKERGSLPYLLTRPIPRWLIPITKFAASFLVAALAIVVGIALTYVLLFGTSTSSDIGYLTTPLLASLLTLFVYGALFILLGTLVERPYLWGIAIVLGWENAANLLVPWVRNFTLTTHIGTALSGAAENPDDGWRLDAGMQWIPEGEPAVKALLILLAIGVAALAFASAQMRRREFQVG